MILATPEARRKNIARPCDPIYFAEAGNNACRGLRAFPI